MFLFKRLQNKTIFLNINFQKTKLSLILEYINQKSGYDFISDTGDVDIEKIQVTGSLEKVLDHLCEIIKYTWTKKNTCILLYKVFHGDGSLPQIKLNEISKLSSEMVDILQRRLSNNEQLSEGFGRIYMTLNEFQKNTLRQRHLFVHELTESQRVLFFQVMNSTLVRESFREWDKNNTLLNLKKDFYIDFSVQDAIFPEDKKKNLKIATMILILFKERPRNKIIYPIGSFLIEAEKI
ncbi:hypothetical protein [Armatimonas sp.]|uniref:hypothetical protein n=1 Tax=Armatimonas sp. TaxID=1872638 RepID=UPI003752F4A3